MINISFGVVWTFYNSAWDKLQEWNNHWLGLSFMGILACTARDYCVYLTSDFYDQVAYRSENTGMTACDFKEKDALWM